MSAVVQALIGSSVASAGGIALVQQGVNTAPAGSPSLILGTTPIAGNSLIACISMMSADSISAVTLNGDVASLIVSSTVLGVTVEIWCKHNGTGGGTGECIGNMNEGTVGSMWVGEFSGVANAAAQDTSTGTATSTALGVVPATQDPTSNSNLVIGIGGYVSATDTYSAGPSNSFTRGTATGGASVFQEVAYLIRTDSHAAVTSDVTITSAAWAGCSASFGGV